MGPAGSTPRTSEKMPQTNILIVEDDLTTREMARMVLENAGYGVSVARSAEEAEEVIRGLWPDIVLMDRELPGMDGLELTRRLRIAEETSGITIIAFSCKQSTEDNERAIDAGSDGFLHKPFTVRGLLQTVAWHVAARGKAGAIRRSPLGDRSFDDSLLPAPTAANRVDSVRDLFGGLLNASRATIMSGLMLVAAGVSASAQTVGTQTLTFSISAINQISVTGTPTLAVTTAVAGSAPNSATSSGNTWAVTTNQTGAKITASIPSNLPSGVTLSANLGAPAGATSAGLKALTTTAIDVVTGITKLAASSLSLTYQLGATSAAGTLTLTTRIVTYTITGGV